MKVSKSPLKAPWSVCRTFTLSKVFISNSLLGIGMLRAFNAASTSAISEPLDWAVIWLPLFLTSISLVRASAPCLTLASALVSILLVRGFHRLKLPICLLLSKEVIISIVLITNGSLLIVFTLVTVEPSFCFSLYIILYFWKYFLKLL